jgi:hypothetical protein
MHIGPIALLMLCICALWPQQTAHANAGPPPPGVWLLFEQDTPNRIDGVRIDACEDAACDSSVPFGVSGACVGDTCGPMTMPDATLLCSSTRCLFWSYDQERFAKPFKLSLRVNGRDLVSKPFLAKSYQTRAFAVSMTVTTVTVTETAIPQGELLARANNMFLALPLTLAIELIVGLLAFKILAVSLRENWAVIPFGTLLTFGGVWIFFPALSGFAIANQLTAGVIALVLGVLCALLFYGLRAPATRGGRIALVVCIAVLSIATAIMLATTIAFEVQRYPSSSTLTFAVPVVLALCGLIGALSFVLRRPTERARQVAQGVSAVAFLIGGSLACLVTLIATSYGNPMPTLALGLPYWLTFALSELYAFGFEALLLYGMTRGALRLRQAGLVSLAINAASMIAGWLVLPRV